MRLQELGYGPFFSGQMELLDDGVELAPARVVADSGGLVHLGGCGAELGELPGGLDERPTTGDWVAVELVDGGERAVVRHVLERRTVLRRRSAGQTGRAQVVAANVDRFFVVTSANRDLNPRRIERYLAAVWDGGATPVVVLNKIDLVDDPSELLATIESVAPGVDVVGPSAEPGEGPDGLRAHLAPGRTVGFVGSSGVGKSSLINRLRGEGAGASATQDIRDDGKGRHTTTRRELVVLPDGGVLIDTPGMREFGVVSDAGGLDTVFEEVARWAESCRFRDCEHEGEPGCAVQGAVDAGKLSAERVASYGKLRREAAAAEARRDPVLGANVKRKWKSITKQMRGFSKD